MIIIMIIIRQPLVGQHPRLEPSHRPDGPLVAPLQVGEVHRLLPLQHPVVIIIIIIIVIIIIRRPLGPRRCEIPPSTFARRIQV